MRDPFEQTDVSTRRAVLVTAIVLAGIAIFALARPSAFYTFVLVFALFVMIMLHELGHFAMAKKTGMKATELFVGFGPRLWSTRRGETEYGVKAIPLGGYVKILGMTNIDEVDPADEPRAYRSKGYGAKVAVAAAGSAMHFIIALVLMFVVLWFGGDVFDPEPIPVVSAVAQGDEPSPAAVAGLEPGDRILAVDGVAVETWDDFTAAVRSRPGEDVTVVVERDGEVVDLDVALADQHPVTGETVGYAGVSPDAVVDSNSPWEAAIEAPGKVWGAATASVSALGDIFSPSGIESYFETLTGANEGQPEANNRFVSPVGFVQIANEAVTSGWVEALAILILINVFIGIFNLIPLLPFDGGHIAIATYEKVASTIRRRKVVVDVEKLMPVTVAVIAVLAFIFVSSLYLDISHPLDINL